ncbi:DUF6978 family protein, partial [Lentilactobacillus parakefiri]|uniref:DUF6978 family protein n=1 Tax=Lentilactobacillus parakefiri TaxID=152332 RepID=UPI001CDA6BCC
KLIFFVRTAFGLILQSTMYKKSEVLLRIDLVGATHRGIPTPHVHIFDDEHDNGFLAIPLDKLEKYNLTEDIIESLQEFLKYNNFDINELSIEQKLI